MSSRGPAEEDLDEVEQHRMPLLDHLKELRYRLLVSAAALGVSLCVSLAFVSDILEFLKAPVTVALAEVNKSGGLTILTPFEGIQVWLNVAFIGAGVLASPVVAYQIWAFIAPGLYSSERKVVLPLALSSTALFLGGAAFAYEVMFPFAFPFFFSVVDADVTLSIQGYLSSITKMLIAFGVCFQLPIGTFFLARTGLIDHRDMMRAFRYSFVGIFLVAAIITPPDPLSQLIVAAPLTILYGVSIVVAWAFHHQGGDSRAYRSRSTPPRAARPRAAPPARATSRP
ncbi:MAG: twin-arginine translocase subunit TatC [Myxococcota bacterium]